MAVRVAFGWMVAHREPPSLAARPTETLICVGRALQRCRLTDIFFTIFHSPQKRAYKDAALLVSSALSFTVRKKGLPRCRCTGIFCTIFHSPQKMGLRCRRTGIFSTIFHSPKKKNRTNSSSYNDLQSHVVASQELQKCKVVLLSTDVVSTYLC